MSGKKSQADGQKVYCGCKEKQYKGRQGYGSGTQSRGNIVYGKGQRKEGRLLIGEIGGVLLIDFFGDFSGG
ncbi:hypothetical protein D5281_16175 [bacterium 1xD42-62]|uniref:Uncharacterized protein n=1 Tax=Parablautia muri TaxID=2320879 RepID=A0A9X5BI76_9FIRM|nr:hypothetical protein [Parablautia muri]